MKVYVIEAEPDGGLKDALNERSALGKAIGTLAKKVNTPVFFHDYTGPVGGAPVILLECGDAFLESVKKLSGVKRVYENSPALTTERSAALWGYFTGSPSTPSRGSNTPKPPGM